MQDSSILLAQKIAAAVASAGGRVYYVGGLVRDSLLGLPSKDVDIEVHGLAPERLEAILRGFGTLTVMGASFGIYRLAHCELDIALPGAANGGREDFRSAADPNMGPEQSARRRDLTINSMLRDVLTGELVDPFGGAEDLRRGILRHVDPETFAEDPLRVLRTARFSAKFGFGIAPETLALCASLDLRGIARERILGETEKALLTPKPSRYFQVLRQMYQLKDWYPEVEALIGTPQDAIFHPEGDVWNHTMLVLDQAAGLADKAEHPTEFLFAALCHDFGKPEATQHIDGRIRAFGHEEAGIPIAQRFLSRLTKEHQLRRYVTNMVQLHMRPNLMAAQNSGKKATNRLFDSSVCPGDLLLLARADHCGKPQPSDYSDTEQFLRTRLEAYRELMAQPWFGGNELAQLGYAPGPDFGEALKLAHKLRLSGVSRENALRQTEAFLRKGKR